MAMMSYLVDDDKDLDDAALWAVIDSAAAASYCSTTTAITANTTTTANSRFRKPLALKNPNLRSSPQIHLPSSPSPPSNHKSTRNYALNPSPRVSFDDWDDSVRPRKFARSEMSESSPDLQVVKRGGGGGFTPVYSSPETGRTFVKEISPYVENNSPQIEYRHPGEKEKVKDTFTHCLAGRFPTVSLFKDYQDAAIKILDKSDYTLISGNPFIKKSGWRKIAFYFNISFEIKDKSLEFDENRNVQRAEFVVRAHMQGGRFSDGWGSCERREKRFQKPNNDIPSTAETRAKNKACQDLVGIGAYRTSDKPNHSSY